MVENKYGNLLKLERKRRGLTQGELGKLLKISDDYVSKIEKGTRDPSELVVDKIVEFLRIVDAEMNLQSDATGICAEPPEPFESSKTAEQKRPSHIYAEGLLAQLSDNDMDEVIANMLERIKRSKTVKDKVYASLSEAGKEVYVNGARRTIRRLEDREAGFLPPQGETVASR